MRFAFSEEQEGLRRGARRFLDERSSSKHVRAVMASELGYDRELWRRIAGDLGWPSLIIPEAYGGAGLTHVELVAVLEETGRALLCAPLFATVCLGAQALLVAGSDEQKREHLPGIAAGRTLATLAHREPGGRREGGEIEATARRDGQGFVLSGRKTFVIDCAIADLFLVVARTSGTSLALFLVPASAPGLARRTLPTLDSTRRLGEVVLDGVRVPGASMLGDEAGAAAALERTLDLACVGLAAEQVGGAQRCLELALEHARTRVQFGRAIGSFQAIKHACADMLVELESARSAAYHAGWCAAEEPAELPVAASLAKATASDAYFHCAAQALQIHGGIGFTWEHDVHLHLKRAQGSETLFGDAAYHRERLAQRLGL